MTNRNALLLILAIGFLLRLSACWQPLMGHFGSYQAVNGMMGTMMAPDFWSGLLQPKSFIVMGGEAGLHLLYCPLGAAVGFIFQQIFGGGLDFWGRFQAVVFMMGAIVCFYLIVRRIYNEKIALLAVIVFNFSPMALVSGISFQNEAVALFFLVLSYWLGMHTPGWKAFLGGLCFSVAMMTRLHFMFMFPAILFGMLLNAPKIPWKRWILFSLGSGLVVCSWYGLMYYWENLFPDRVITGFWGQMGEGRILAKSIFEEPGFYKRLTHIFTELWFTPVLFPFLILGFFQLKDKRVFPFVLWILGGFITLVVLPRKVLDHPFYLLGCIPAASVLIALMLAKIREKFPKKWVAGLLIVFFLFSLRYYVPPAFSMTGFEKGIPEIGQKVNELTNEEDFVVAQYGTGPHLLYYTGRAGWPFDLDMEGRHYEDQARITRALEKGYGEPIRWLEYLRSQGADYFVVSEIGDFKNRRNFYNYVTEHFQEVGSDQKKYLIFDLRKRNA